VCGFQTATGRGRFATQRRVIVIERMTAGRAELILIDQLRRGEAA